MFKKPFFFYFFDKKLNSVQKSSFSTDPKLLQMFEKHVNQIFNYSRSILMTWSLTITLFLAIPFWKLK